MKSICHVVMGALLVGSGSGLIACTPSVLGSPAATRIAVQAPFAQQLIVKLKNQHPEIQKLSLHAVPPGQTQSAIIASNLSEKIGKLSSPDDLAAVAAGQPNVHRVEQGKFWDTFVPVHDYRGDVIGFLIMEVPFRTASTESEAIAVGTMIRNQLQQQVPTLETLFGPAKQ
ncbi:hypothetical protein ACFPT7_12950 [Acidicapsa dinghuensis]|uniref:Lipoprotein n=1 Tax=Acidicapsa dinghuensis TaxID=2218256 RepID=A0ABW1EH83_9BACT|nr:hypothetical protein [Acidicapsa dinghuensis]